MKRSRWLLAGVLIGGLGAAIMINHHTAEEEKLKQKETRDEILREMGADEGNIDALNASFENLAKGAESIGTVKNKVADAVSEGIINHNPPESAPEAQNKPETAAGEITDLTKEQLADYAKQGLKEATESLPYFTEKDVDDMVQKIVDKVTEATSEEALKDYLEATGSFEEFNGVLTEKMTDEKLGPLGQFMKRWINNIPDINQIDPSQKTDN